MGFLEVVGGLRAQLGIDDALSVSVAVVTMSEMMGLDTVRHPGPGSAIPLPEQVEALCECLGFSLPLPGDGGSDVQGVANSDDSDDEEDEERGAALAPAPAEKKQRACSAAPRFIATLHCCTTCALIPLRSPFTGTVGSFFGPGVRKEYVKGRLANSELISQHDKHATDTGGVLTCFCGRQFNHGPAFLVHRKFCPRAIMAEDQDSLESHSEPGDSESAGANDNETLSSAGNSNGGAPTPQSSSRSSGSARVRKDGKRKESGLREGQKRAPHTIYLKYQVAKEFEAFNRLKLTGEISDPLQRTSDLYNGLAKSNIWKWYQQIDALHEALTHETSGVQKKCNRAGMLIGLKAARARRLSLHRGAGATFNIAEDKLYRDYKSRRSKGLRVVERWLVINMRKNIREYYGDEMADKFKGSYGLLSH